MVDIILGVMSIASGLCFVWAILGLFKAADALRDECQMMRTSRSAAAQCPLAGKVK